MRRLSPGSPRPNSPSTWSPPRPNWPAGSSSTPAPTPGSTSPRWTPSARTRWRRPKRSTSPGTSAAARSPSSPRSATGGGPAAGWWARRPWPWPPVRPRWPWPGGPAKRGSGPRPWTNTSTQLHVPGQWTRPAGLLRPVDEIAMLTRRYMHEYGATREHLANVATAVRGHANMNPAALMYKKTMSREDYMDAALGVGAALSLRQLPGDRRGAGLCDRLGRTGP